MKKKEPENCMQMAQKLATKANPSFAELEQMWALIPIRSIQNLIIQQMIFTCHNRTDVARCQELSRKVDRATSPYPTMAELYQAFRTMPCLAQKGLLFKSMIFQCLTQEDHLLFEECAKALCSMVDG